MKGQPAFMIHAGKSAFENIIFNENRRIEYVMLDLFVFYILFVIIAFEIILFTFNFKNINFVILTILNNKNRYYFYYQLNSD